MYLRYFFNYFKMCWATAVKIYSNMNLAGRNWSGIYRIKNWLIHSPAGRIRETNTIKFMIPPDLYTIILQFNTK